MRSEKFQSGCRAVTGDVKRLAGGYWWLENAVGAGVGVRECLWGRVRAGVLGGGGGGPPQQKQSNDPQNNQHNPQYTNYRAPLTRKRHIPPHPAQPRHTNDWAPRTRKRHQQEHRPQRPTERSDPTQHAEGRTGDCPGPRKETTTRRNVTQPPPPPP